MAHFTVDPLSGIEAAVQYLMLLYPIEDVLDSTEKQGLAHAA
jgi:hypothetical protein